MKSNLPHFRVFARIGRSKIHGVGVFAIKPIKKGEYVFYPDNDKVRSVKVDNVKRLPKEIRRFYDDFCIKENGKYICPTNFNKLTPAWFLNHSDNPNIAADSDYRFYALKAIKKGEELTANYSTYSE